MWLLAWIPRLFIGAGILPQITKFVVVVLAAISISFGLIQYGRSIERHEVQVEHYQNYIETRGRIDEAAKDNPTGDPTIALDNLRRMYPIGK